MNPRRRPLAIDPHLDIATFFAHAATRAPVIELGISCLKDEMRDAGWPARSPEPPTTGGVRIRIQCRTCGVRLDGALAKDEHTRDTGHDLFSYVPEDAPPPSGIDYSDPTGDQAIRYERLTSDLDAYTFHWQRLMTSWQAIVQIGMRNVPAAIQIGEPACSIVDCESVVERTTSGNGYRKMRQVAGHWVAEPGQRPVCGAHRKATERGAA